MRGSLNGKGGAVIDLSMVHQQMGSVALKVEPGTKPKNVQPPSIYSLDGRLPGTLSSDMSPTLRFFDIALENHYVKGRVEVSMSQYFGALIGTLLVAIIAIATDLGLSTHDSQCIRRVGLAAASMGPLILLQILGMQRLSCIFNPIVPFFIILMGSILWAIRCSIPLDGSDPGANALALVCWLLACQSFARPLIFQHSTILTIVTCGIFTIVSAVTKHSQTTQAGLAAGICLLWIAAVGLMTSQFDSEHTDRKRVFAQLQYDLSSKEAAKLKRDEFGLRTEVFAMTLAQYDIADIVGKEKELQSPAEKAMAKLQNLSHASHLPQDLFKEVTEIIKLLGSSGDLFKPVFEQKEGTFDEDTERWIFDLLNGEQGRQQQVGRAGPSKEDEDAAATGASSTALSKPIGDPESRSTSVPTAIAGEENAIVKYLEKVDDWEFDVLELSTLTKGRPLTALGHYLFQKWELDQHFKLDKARLHNFLSTVEAGYQDAPYHNNSHGADVARTLHFFLAKGEIRSYLSPLEIMAALIAGLVHDVDHPGRTNQFHIASGDLKAILYNDKSVLENHHSAQAFFYLRRPENAFLNGLDDKDYAVLRKTIIDMVLHTDLALHFEFVSQFKSMHSGQTFDKTNEKSRHMVLKMALKCGDLGHAAKPRHLHEKWTLRIMEEFYRQGDEERRRGMPISPFMDRQKANVPHAQVGFLEFLVIPMFSAWQQFLNLSDSDVPCLSLLKGNHEHWKKALDASKVVETPRTSPAPSAPASPGASAPAVSVRATTTTTTTTIAAAAAPASPAAAAPAPAPAPVASEPKTA